MQYKASVQLKQADTTGRVPLSILDGFVREELLRQITGALKPHLTIQQAALPAEASNANHLDQIDFTTELVILSSDRWHQFKKQLTEWYTSTRPDDSPQLQALLDSLDDPATSA